MANYTLALFLLSKLSGERVVNSLAEKNLGISTMFDNKTLYSNPNENGSSVILGANLQTSLTVGEISGIISKILEEKKVPHFGYVIHQSVNGIYSTGFFPKEEDKEKLPSAGPYR